MSIHWGHSIFAFYTFFVAVLVLVVIKSTSFDNSLVSRDYYAQDLAFQQEYERRLNSNRLSEPVSLEKQEDTYYLQFPILPSEGGEIHFYCPMSERFDRKKALAVDASGKMDLDLKGLRPGYYRVIARWSSGGAHYLDEFDLQVQPSAR